MNDKTNTGNPDRKLINLTENYDVEYWTRTLEISKEVLIKAVNAVGYSADAVEEYLKTTLMRERNTKVRCIKKAG